MIKYLIKDTVEIRFETIEDVKKYQEELRKQASDEGYLLSSYSWAEKNVTVKGEVVDVYYLVKYVLTFNDPKNPEIPLRKITYNMVDNNEQEF